MKLVQRSFSINDINNFVGIVIELNNAINTSYIPVASCIPGLMQRFTEIQLGRSFSNCGFGQADLSLVFNEKYCVVYYSSTSGTVVNISYNFDNDMKVSSIDLEVDLPDDRAISGRSHYETLTKALYSYDWYRLSEDRHDFIIVIPNQLTRLNSGVDIPIPEWVLDIESNFEFSRNMSILQDKYNYVEVDAIGFYKVWRNPEMHFEYIVHKMNYSWGDNNLYVLSKLGVNVGEYARSYRALQKVLDNGKTKTFVQEKRLKYGFRSDDELDYALEDEYSDGEYEEVYQDPVDPNMEEE